MEDFTDAEPRHVWVKKRHRRGQKNSFNTVIVISRDFIMKKLCFIVFFIMIAHLLKRKYIIHCYKKRLIFLKRICINGQTNFLKNYEKNEKWP